MAKCNKGIYCNACGNKLEFIPRADVYEDHLFIKKEWGYFSNKDFMKHSFYICEQCYDKWVDTFVIPIEKEIKTEWACNLPERAPDLKYKKPRK